MKNIRMISGVLIVVLLLSCMVLPAGAEEAIQLLSIVGIENETVWIHTSAGLIPFSKDGEIIGEALYPAADCYAIGPDGNIFYSVNGDIFEMDRAGKEVDKWLTPVDNFIKILANDTYIIIMGDEEYGAIHMDDHIMQSGVVDGVQDIGFYSGDSFVLLQEGITSLLVEIDCETMEDTAVKAISVCDGIAYSSETEGCYVHLGGDIYHLDLFEDNSTNYMAIQSGEYVRDMCLWNENIYVITAATLMVYPRKDANAQSKVLTIYNGFMFSATKPMQKAIEIFTQRHPEYTVQLTNSVGTEKLYTALLANDAGYDILRLDGNQSSAVKLSGILEELSSNAVITENLEKYFEMPFLWESDGRLYGIPLMVTPFGFTMTRALYDESGLELDAEWTWDDFYALKDVAQECGLRLTAEDRYWQTFRRQYECVYCDYMQGEADYQTDEFRNVVSIWKDLDKQDMIAPKGNENILLEYSGLVPAQPFGMGDKSVYLGMPKLDGEYATPIYMDGLYVNRQSEHADAAIEFLEIYSSEEVQRESSMLFLADLESYSEYSLWEMFDQVPTEEQLALWQHFLCTGKLFERNDDFDAVIASLVNAFVDDELTLDEFVAEVQERADLMVGE